MGDRGRYVGRGAHRRRRADVVRSDAPQAQTAPPRISRMTIASSGAAALVPTAVAAWRSRPTARASSMSATTAQLFVRPLDRLDATAIFTGAAPLNWVFVSPDGQWVGFEEGSTLKKVALTGGPAVTIVKTGLGLRAGRPGRRTTRSSLPRRIRPPACGACRPAAATSTVLTRPDQARGELDHLWPEMLPGGRAVLFTITATTGGLEAAQVAVLDLATGTPKVLVRGGSHAHYVPSGHLVYTAGGTLRAVPFDLARLETRGTPVTVLPRLVTKPQGAGDFVVAADGTLAYVDAPDAAAAATRWCGWIGRAGRSRWRRPRVPTSIRACRRTGRGWRWPSRPGARHLGVGSRTPDAQPADVRLPG